MTLPLYETAYPLLQMLQETVRNMEDLQSRSNYESDVALRKEGFLVRMRTVYNHDNGKVELVEQSTIVSWEEIKGIPINVISKKLSEMARDLEQEMKIKTNEQHTRN